MHMSANMQEMTIEILTRYGFQVLGAVAFGPGLLWPGGWGARTGASRSRRWSPDAILLVRRDQGHRSGHGHSVALDNSASRVALSSAGIGWPVSARVWPSGVFRQPRGRLTSSSQAFPGRRVHRAQQCSRRRGTVELLHHHPDPGGSLRVIVPTGDAWGESCTTRHLRQLTLTIRVPHTTD